jgi:hypothetical protein
MKNAKGHKNQEMSLFCEFGGTTHAPQRLVHENYFQKTRIHTSNQYTTKNMTTIEPK